MLIPTKLIRCEYPPNDGVMPGNERFDSLLNDVKKNGIKEPIIINLNWYVIHGNHRLSVARQLGIDRIEVRVWTGTEFVD